MNGITDGVVTLSNPSHVDISADRAYVVIPANYTFKQKGKPARPACSKLGPRAASRCCLDRAALM
jgi:hypothetical protein